MPDDAPGFSAAQVRVPIVPDTSAMDAFWEQMESRRDRFVEETRQKFQELSEGLTLPEGAVDAGGGSSEDGGSEVERIVTDIKNALETDITLLLGAILGQLQEQDGGLIGG